MPDDVPLICDPPPGARWVLKTNRIISADDAARLRAGWNEWASSGDALLILPDGFDLAVFPGRYEWPDAEFCAA